MRSVKLLLLAGILFATPLLVNSLQKENSKLNGPYLGQPPPGMTPQIFAPGFISTNFGELNSMFTKTGNEFYFSRRGIPGKPSVIMVTRMVNGSWSVPKPVSFSGNKDDIDLFITPDGMSMIFSSGAVNTQKPGSHPDHDFWISHRTGEKWSDPIPFAKEASSEFEDYYPVVTGSGNLYFNSQRSGPGTNDIYCSKKVNHKYTKPVKMPGPINTQYREFDAFLTQDEKMIIFSSDRPGGTGGADLYVSWKNADGTWSEPRNLGEKINSEYSEYGASLTSDSKYLFFTSDRNGSEDIYWVSAKVIEAMRPKK